MQHTKSLFALVGIAGLVAGAVAADAATTTRPAYGCYKVSAASAQLRDKGSTGGNVIATAPKGDVLVKTKRFCGFGGIYCAVSYNGVAGFIEKAAVKVAACPASTSKPKP